jgi:hypothetical protein
MLGGTPLTVDQRGFLRILDGDNNGTGTVDQGAVEFQFPATSTTLTVSPTTPTPFNAPLTLTATVAPVSPAPTNTPSGTVTFVTDSMVLGTVPLDGSGVATLITQGLPAGTNTVVARYNGDRNFAASSGSVLQEVLIRTTTAGAYDPATGMWFLRNSNSAGPPDVAAFAFGPPGSLPLVGDWDGDGTFTIGVFDPATATFMLRNSNTPGAADFIFAFGPAGVAIPVAGDWDGDGRWGVGTFDPNTARWDLRNELSAGLPTGGTVLYGAPGSVPVVGDWDGDGDFNIGVVEPDGTWKLKNDNVSGPPDFTFAYGTFGVSNFLAGDWDGDGVYSPGVADPESGVLTWKLRNSNSSGPPDLTQFAYGGDTFLPVTGDWNFPALPLLAEGGELFVNPVTDSISTGQLAGVVSAALGRLQQAGVQASLLAELANVVVEIGQLAPGKLGLAYVGQDRIVVDANAAGHGWFVDPTPLQDEEFLGGRFAGPGSAAEGRMDLLSVVLHEMGHIAGLVDWDGSELMAGELAQGRRTAHALDQVFGSMAAEGTV